MSKARIHTNSASLPPEALKMLGELCDEVWASVAEDVGDDPDEIETAQIRLARIILDLAQIRDLQHLEIAGIAAALIRQKCPQGSSPLSTATIINDTQRGNRGT